MTETVLRIEDVPNKETTLYVPDKRYSYGKRHVSLGNADVDKINHALKKYPNTISLIIGGWPLTIDMYNQLLANGSINW